MQFTIQCILPKCIDISNNPSKYITYDDRQRIELCLTIPDEYCSRNERNELIIPVTTLYRLNEILQQWSNSITLGSLHWAERACKRCGHKPKDDFMLEVR